MVERKGVPYMNERWHTAITDWVSMLTETAAVMRVQEHAASADSARCPAPAAPPDQD